MPSVIEIKVSLLRSLKVTKKIVDALLMILLNGYGDHKCVHYHNCPTVHNRSAKQQKLHSYNNNRLPLPIYLPNCTLIIIIHLMSCVSIILRGLCGAHLCYTPALSLFHHITHFITATTTTTTTCTHRTVARM